jgi:FkbH-like protein
MSAELYTNLAWLLPPTADFRQRCRALASDAMPGRAIGHLAAYSLDESQLRHLALAIETARADGKQLAPLTAFKLGLLGNATLEPLVPALVATAARHGIDLQCVKADYAQTLQEALAPDSIINRANPDAVLLALDHRGLPLHTAVHDPQSAVADSIAFLDSMRRGFQIHSNALSIVQTLPTLPETAFGSFDRTLPGTLRRLCTDFNAALVEDLKGTHDVILDVATLAETVGLANWHAPGQWNIGKFAFDTKFLPLYADHVARLIGALKGKSRKCLVLDLDNTLWGGVIGDDGIEGIVIGQGDATGEAYLDVQRAALDLRDRGIVLAISSKNADEVARSAFRGHPEMLLSENHIAVFQANWNDKATNIAAIASELSLGLDSIVFVDDNPAERALVREVLPEVAVPELPEDPALYARTIAAAGYFEAVAFSPEDRKRADFYTDNARRVALRTQIGDLDKYLVSLQMKIVFRPFDTAGRGRITQLINKSNQFNLTTRRYSELEVAELERNPAYFTLQARLLDTFGDNGIISVVVCRPRSKSVWELDTWLMSCRVLGRRVEQMVLREILSHACARGITTLIGIYLPSEKNALVRDHYKTLGFELIEQGEDGRTTWQLDTATKVEAAPMTVDSADFRLAPA